MFLPFTSMKWRWTCHNKSKKINMCFECLDPEWPEIWRKKKEIYSTHSWNPTASGFHLDPFGVLVAPFHPRRAAPEVVHSCGVGPRWSPSVRGWSGSPGRRSKQNMSGLWHLMCLEIFWWLYYLYCQPAKISCIFFITGTISWRIIWDFGRWPEQSITVMPSKLIRQNGVDESRAIQAANRINGEWSQICGFISWALAITFLSCVDLVVLPNGRVESLRSSVKLWFSVSLLVGGANDMYVYIYIYTRTFQGATFWNPYRLFFKGLRFDTP